MRTPCGHSDVGSSSKATQLEGKGSNVISRSVLICNKNFVKSCKSTIAFNVCNHTVLSLSKNQCLLEREPISSKWAIAS